MHRTRGAEARQGKWCEPGLAGQGRRNERMEGNMKDMGQKSSLPMVAKMKMFTMIYFLSFSAFSTAFPGREFTCPPGYVLDAVHGYCKLYNLPIRAVCTSCQGPLPTAAVVGIVVSCVVVMAAVLFFVYRRCWKDRGVTTRPVQVATTDPEADPETQRL
uniref:Uncharacterized protein n=1 Tax=Branchiostoma floridae TaxID=7739 RepID=C3ZG47_BRAFL|eukprot:XP_002592511.1 hypothetical protein BRAFLDRAFT_69002 [Branchiostoma floridae]